MGTDTLPVYTSRAIPEVDWASTGLALPARLQSQIPKRMRLTAALAMTVSVVSIFFALEAWRQGEPLYHAVLQFTGIALAIIAASLIIRFVDRFQLRTALLGALITEVVVCLFISVGNPSYELPMGKTLPCATWIVPIMIMFPFLIPTPPKWTRRASAACVMTVPLGTIIAYYASKQSDLNAATIPLAMVSPAVAAVIACVGSSLIYEIGVYAEKVSHAGNFQLIKEIGKGGMGVVYEAKHNRLPMRAAVKYINKDQLQKRLGGGDRAIKRFTREAGTLAELCSPHTVEIYDFDLDDEGKLFYVMELLEGWDLNTLVDEFNDPVPPARVAYLLAQACGALAEAHERNVIHRDVKPSNIMTCRYGRDLDFVKVLDFGIMTIGKEECEASGKEEREASNSSRPGHDENAGGGLTIASVAVGTPDYMSPEQANHEALDQRSDIYALGCVAYYLLTGKLVFPGGTDHDKMQRHMNETPIRPSKNTKQYIPPALDDLVMSCLEKRREDRPQNADQLAAALLNSVSENSVSETWSAADIQAWWKKNGLPKRSASATSSVSVTVSELKRPDEKKPAWVVGVWRRLSTWG